MQSGDILSRLNNILFTIATIQFLACTYSYNVTKVKIASWLCMGEDDLQNFQNTSDCYFRTYGNENEARGNSNPDTEVKDLANFYLVNVEGKAYYDKAGLICLIVFLFIPGSFFLCQCTLVYVALPLEEDFENCVKNWCRGVRRYISWLE